MKPYVLFVAVMAAPAFAHEAEPQTDFFREQLAKNPLTAEVLNWCHLAGLPTEQECMDEMYEKNGSINSVRLDAATKCVQKSGMYNYARLDALVGKGLKEKNSWLGHEVKGGGRHLSPMVDPKNPKEGEHYYFYPAYQRKIAGEMEGERRVELLKKSVDDKASATSTAGGSTSATFSTILGWLGIETNTELTAEKAKTHGPLTQDELKAEFYRGYTEGYKYPQMVKGMDQPAGYCVSRGQCEELTGVYAEHERFSKEMEFFGIHKDPKPEATAEVPKTSIPSPTIANEENSDPFGPFTSGTATGGIKTEPEKPKESADKKPKDENTTTLGPQDTQFLEKMQACLSFEENEILKDEGKMHRDPEAKTDEERREEAEQKLAQGVCDEAYFGRQFCHAWKQEQNMTEEEDAATKRKEAYDRAMNELLSSGTCREEILGWEFCKAAKDQLDTTRAPNFGEESHFDPWKPSHVNPVNGGPGEGIGFGPVESGRQPAPKASCERDMFGDCKR